MNSSRIFFDLFDSPELLDIQRTGFYDFLKQGIPQLLAKEFPIKVRNGNYSLELCLNEKNVKLIAPENDPRDCILKMKTYNCKLYAQVKIVCKKSPYVLYKSKEKVVYQSLPEWVLLGQLPMMTKRGHFIINGSPRVIVHQVVRAPGIYFQKLLKKDDQKKARFYGDIIPLKGVWVRLQMSKKGRVEAKFKKGKKVEVELLQKCLQVLENQTFSGYSTTFNKSMDRSHANYRLASCFGSWIPNWKWVENALYKSYRAGVRKFFSKSVGFGGYKYKSLPHKSFKASTFLRSKVSFACDQAMQRVVKRFVRKEKVYPLKSKAPHTNHRFVSKKILLGQVFTSANQRFARRLVCEEAYLPIKISKQDSVKKARCTRIRDTLKKISRRSKALGETLSQSPVFFDLKDKDPRFLLYDDYSKVFDKKKSKAESKSEDDAFIHTYDKLYRTTQDKELEEWQKKKKNQNFFKSSCTSSGLQNSADKYKCFGSLPHSKSSYKYKSKICSCTCKKRCASFTVPFERDLNEKAVLTGEAAKHQKDQREIPLAKQNNVLTPSPYKSVIGQDKSYQTSFCKGKKETKKKVFSGVSPSARKYCSIQTQRDEGGEKAESYARNKASLSLPSGKRKQVLSPLHDQYFVPSSSPENAFKRKKCSENLFATFKLQSRYDLGLLGREKINTKFGLLRNRLCLGQRNSLVSKETTKNCLTITRGGVSPWGFATEQGFTESSSYKCKAELCKRCTTQSIFALPKKKKIGKTTNTNRRFVRSFVRHPFASQKTLLNENNTTQLTAFDLCSATLWLYKLRKGEQSTDDIDHSQNRRVKTSGDLLQTQFENGVYRLKKLLSTKLQEWRGDLSSSVFSSIFKFSWRTRYTANASFKGAKKAELSYFEKKSLLTALSKCSDLTLDTDLVSFGLQISDLYTNLDVWGFAPQQSFTLQEDFKGQRFSKAFFRQKEAFGSAYKYKSKICKKLCRVGKCKSKICKKLCLPQSICKPTPKGILSPFGRNNWENKRVEVVSILNRIRLSLGVPRSQERKTEGLETSLALPKALKAKYRRISSGSLTEESITPQIFLRRGANLFTMWGTERFAFSGPSPYKSTRSGALPHTLCKSSCKSSLPPNKKICCGGYNAKLGLPGSMATSNERLALPKTSISSHLKRDISLQKVGKSQSTKKFTKQQSNELSHNSLAKELFSTKPITGALREFFGSNPLSQYMDQTNPLAEITHKRRISSLGVGGVSRESAGMAIRGIHPTHYGRICPIETPEGKNAGLVNSLAFYTKVQKDGFLKTPYYRVFKGQIQSSLGFSFCSAKEESVTGLQIAPSDLQKSSNQILRTRFSTPESVPVRVADNLLDVFKKENRYKVQLVAISPIQMISVATSLIPFLEHNDANRALMGSNMQRQAIPLMISERPVVGTGVESIVIVESGHITESQTSGFASHVAANKIVIDTLSYKEKESPPSWISTTLSPLFEVKSRRNTQTSKKSTRLLKERGKTSLGLLTAFMDSRAKKASCKSGRLWLTNLGFDRVRLRKLLTNLLSFALTSAKLCPSKISDFKGQSFARRFVCKATCPSKVQSSAYKYKSSCLQIYDLYAELCWGAKPQNKFLALRQVRDTSANTRFTTGRSTKSSHQKIIKACVCKTGKRLKKIKPVGLFSLNMEHLSTVASFKSKALFAFSCVDAPRKKTIKSYSVLHEKEKGLYSLRSSFLLRRVERSRIKERCIQKQSFLLSTVSPLTTFSRSNQNTCITEKPLLREFDWVQKGDIVSDCLASNNGELAVGKNVLLAYIPWEGYNFEDAIVISERLVREHVYTSLHIEKYVFQAQDLKDGNEWFTKHLPGVEPRSIQHLEESGLPKIGSFLKEGDILVGKIRYLKKKPSTPYERLLCDILGEKNFAVRNKSLYVPKGVEARVIYHKVISIFDNDPENKVRPLEAAKTVHLFLGEKRVIQVGDKISGRHGNKGVISTILPRQDMPYLPDGTPIDIILNPLGVPSRMNVGQVLECLLGLAATYLNQHFKITAFDERYGVEASKSLVFLKLYQARLQSGQNWLFQLAFPGKTRLVDGRSGECFDQWITVGRAYILKLIHMVSEKIHARSTGPYALITQQPLRGRSNQGGQRLGEMEVWALEGFGAAYTLQELLTKKSDDFFGRKQIVDSILPNPTSIVDTLQPYNRINQNRTILGHPEIFKVLLCELQALCLDLGVYVVTPDSFQRTFLGIIH